MAMPPRDAPERPLANAVNAARVLGALFLILAVLLGCVATFAAGGIGIAFAVFVGVYAVPGVLLMVFASHMHARRKWAVIATLTLGGLIVLLFSIGLLATVLEGGSVGSLVGIVLLLAAVLLVVYCIQSLRRWDLIVDPPRGFAPIMAHPVAPLPPTAPGAAAPTDAGGPQ